MTIESNTAEILDEVVADTAIDQVRANKADSTIKNYVISSMVVGMVPMPVFDLAALIALQLKMVHNLCQQYDVEYKKNLGKTIIGSLVAGLVPITATIAMSSVLKLIPGFGSLASGATVSVLGGALTYAVGRVFVRHFESGGTLLDFDVAKYRARFKKDVEEGKSVAKDLAPEARAT
jgi:uncharacterized protein (DUF697 family)